MIRKILLGAVASAPAYFACDGGESVPVAPPPPPPLPAFGISFTEAALEVREGEALAVNVRYEVRELPGPVQVRLSASHEFASEADYELAVDSIEIPAGRDLAGEATFEVSALADLFFTEGAEVLPLAFAYSAGQADLGDPVAISILEAGASPCPGVTVVGLPWREEESPDDDVANMLATTLNFEIGADGAGARLEILGPYVDLGVSGRIAESVSAFGINRWSVRTGPRGIVHELDVNWSGEEWFEEEAEESLDLAFLGGACSGDPVASCTSAGCEIIP